MKTLPTTTAALVAANLAVFGLELTQGGEAICQAHGLIPATFLQNGDPSPIVTSLFLHDPSTYSHIVLNMVALAVLGPVVERALGGLRFLSFYLAAGALAALCHVAVDPAATAALVGASGAIFGVLGVATVIDRRLIGFTVPFVGFAIFDAFSGSAGTVAVAAHLGGFAAGIFFAFITRSTLVENY